MLSPENFRKFGVYGGLVFFTITGMAQPFFSLYAVESGASTAVVGFMVTLRAVLPLFIAMPAGQLIDSIGPFKMIRFGTILLILSLFMTGLSSNLWMLSLSQLFLGASIVITASSLQVMVSTGDPKERNESIKKYSMWMSAGGMIGPLLGGGIVSLFETELTGYRMTFLISSLLSVLALGVILFVSNKYPHSSKSEASSWGLLKPRGIAESYLSGIHLAKNRKVQFGLIGTFLIMYIQSLYMSFFPIFLSELGYGSLFISVALAAKGLSGMLSRYVVSWVMKYIEMEKILIAAGVLAAVCVMVTPFAGLHIASTIILIVILGAAVGINLPISIMIMVNDTKESDRGKLMGLRLLTNRFSQIISPAMFGILGQSIGLTAAFYTGGVFLVLTMLGFSAFSNWRFKLPKKEIDHDIKY